MRTPLRLAVLALVLCAPVVHAGGQGYVGASVGGAAVEAEIDLIPLDETDLGFKLFGGYRFTDHFGVEFGYADFGSHEAGQDTATLKTDLAGWSAAAVGIAPVGERFEVFGKLGLFFAETGIDSTAGLEPYSATDRTTEFSLGIGGAYKLRHLAIRAELEYFGSEEFDRVYLLSVGVEYRF